MSAYPRRAVSRVLVLAIILSVPGAIASPHQSASAQGATAPVRIASGDVTQTSAFLWAISAKTGTLAFEYGTDADFKAVLGTVEVAVPDPTIPVKTMVSGLQPGTRYFYRATDAGGATAKGTFRSAAPPGKFAGLRFGVSGDWRQELLPYPSIKNIPARDLEFFVKLGDTIYADIASPDVPLRQATTLAQYRAKHNEALSARYGLNVWADARASTSILAMIDDHEVTNDFSGGAPPAGNPKFDRNGQFINETNLYKAGLQAFIEYMPIAAETYSHTGDPRLDGKPKLYRARTYGNDAIVILTDARSFRDEPVSRITDLDDPAQVHAFLKAAAAPGRTMLGGAQLALLKADLFKAQTDGITWKFVMIPEPVQNFGPAGGPDRFEGYAAERNDLLAFIKDKGIENVVFVSADIHGTIVNNLTYQPALDGPQLSTGAWEITTGPVAFDAPFGQTVAAVGVQAKILTPAQKSLYDLLPLAQKDGAMKQLLDVQLRRLNYDLIGLNSSGIDATLIRGDYVAVHTYGWTEFEIDARTQALLVTTYGIPAYSRAQLDADPAAITAQSPAIISQFSVRPHKPA